MNVGSKHSAEVRAKMSRSSKGQVPWNKGKNMPKTTGIKIHLRNLGNTYHLGKRHSLETRLKISARRQGKATGSSHPHWKGGTTERMRRHNKTRAYRVLIAGGSHTEAEWQLLKAQYNFTCPACFKAEPAIKLTKDHIIPVVKGGSSNIENIQPLCKRCNSKKHTAITQF